MGFEPHECALIAFIFFCFFLIGFIIILSTFNMGPTGFLKLFHAMICDYRNAKSWDEKILIAISLFWKLLVGSIVSATIAGGFTAIGLMATGNDLRGILRDAYRVLLHLLGKPDIPDFQ